MNYEEMSDFEVNSAVHNAIRNLGFSLEFLGCDRIKWSRKGEQAIFTGKAEYSKNGLIDYCNNPSYAWPIIFENKIAIKPCATKRSSNKEWYATNLEKITSSSQENPLRAAMIVFLMIQEQAK